MLALLIALAGCSPPGPEAGRSLPPGAELNPLESPAAAGAGEPRLFAAADAVHMSWIEPTATGQAVRVSTLRGNRWSNPTTVIEATDLFVNWADFPSVVETTDGALVVHWLQRSGPGPYAYDVRMSRSHDGGLTWSEPYSPHHDGTHTEHGFVTLVPEPDGDVTAVWLDGRETTTGAEPGDAGHGPGGPMTLRSARIDASGELSDEHLLDARTCDCCQTGAALAGEDLIVVYRDRSEQEVRDIWTVARRSGAWTEPQRLSFDDWMIPGCPVNGPAIDARGADVAVAWFALVDGAPEVKLAFSGNAGRTFDPPVLLERGGGSEQTLGRVDVLWIDADTAVVTWLTGSGPDAEIRARAIERDGTAGTARALAPTRSTRSSGFPRIVRDGGRLILAWTVPGPEPGASEIRVGELRLLDETG